MKISKTVTLLIALAALADGFLGAIYLRETWYQVTQEPSFVKVGAGLLMAGAIFLFAKNFEPRTAKNIIYSVSLLTFIQTCSYCAQSISKLNLFFHVLEFGGDLLILYGCLRHFKKLKDNKHEINGPGSF